MADPDSPGEAARAAAAAQRRVSQAEASLRELRRERDLAVAAEGQRPVTHAEASLRSLRRERGLAVYVAVRAGVAYADLAEALELSEQTVWSIVKRFERSGGDRLARP